MIWDYIAEKVDNIKASLVEKEIDQSQLSKDKTVMLEVNLQTTLDIARLLNYLLKQIPLNLKLPLGLFNYLVQTFKDATYHFGFLIGIFYQNLVDLSLNYKKKYLNLGSLAQKVLPIESLT